MIVVNHEGNADMSMKYWVFILLAAVVITVVYVFIKALEGNNDLREEDERSRRELENYPNIHHERRPRTALDVLDRALSTLVSNTFFKCLMSGLGAFSFTNTIYDDMAPLSKVRVFFLSAIVIGLIFFILSKGIRARKYRDFFLGAIDVIVVVAAITSFSSGLAGPGDVPPYPIPSSDSSEYTNSPPISPTEDPFDRMEIIPIGVLTIKHHSPVNIRSGVGEDAPVLFTANTGDTFTYIGETENSKTGRMWYVLRLDDGRTAFVTSSYAFPN